MAESSAMPAANSGPAELPSLADSRKMDRLLAPFASRMHGYRQVTDALLLGLAIKHKSVLVTLDVHVRALAGAEFRDNVLILE